MTTLKDVQKDPSQGDDDLYNLSSSLVGMEKPRRYRNKVVYLDDYR